MVRLAVLEERFSALLDRHEESQRRTDQEIHSLRSEVKAIDSKLGELVDAWKTARSSGRAYLSVAASIAAIFGWLGFPAIIEGFRRLFGASGH